jgi:plastocyanin
MTARTIAALTLAAALGACGGGGGYGGGGGGGGGQSGGVTEPPAPTPRTVMALPSLAFSPSSITVKAGDVVTFAFGAVGHDVFFDAQAGAPANIGGVNANVSVQRTFATPGTYGYTCHIHPFMHGTVVVQ